MALTQRALYNALNDINNLFNVADTPTGSLFLTGSTSGNPRTDVIETSAAYEIFMELPGMDKKDINVEWKNDSTLVLQGEIQPSYKALKETFEQDEGKEKEKHEDKQKDKEKSHLVRRWLNERPSGSFSRAFTFPSRVNHEAITACHENGLLTIIVPKAEKTSTQITIQ
ncbi:hypothetical protein EC973_005044 [Apophysomyces ossiformis]|uniref:SHSP domain-containing protein n=1 Tax=Apophysomyces ossiformis TaxID=679940 RepID=A0A8H7BSF2_9FUNG|nr:hypothetical protein EC973_005044 [Apophysomyces ossiformis]